MRTAAIGALLFLGGCTGTQLVADGSICGQQVSLELGDYKDRSNFSLDVDCPGGGGVRVTSEESLASPVAKIQADTIAELSKMLGELAVRAAPVPGVSSSSSPMPSLKPIGFENE